MTRRRNRLDRIGMKHHRCAMGCGAVVFRRGKYCSICQDIANALTAQQKEQQRIASAQNALDRLSIIADIVYGDER